MTTKKENEKRTSIATGKAHPDAHGWIQSHPDAHGFVSGGGNEEKGTDGKWHSKYLDAHGWVHSSSK